ncbi:conserved hypothetical protein [Mycolicibacterium smegmatis MC2 155]|uniref:Uncharacterized protein n=1 Tax=Mycolicibacterium smegmatis (strain ATCC 700084 / mc(2)155) TaxID=246196 RepID=A0QYC4_MYCS2|nr:conserved hypothetical protein [Mycolicibacterium smegmatis MC2 155]
MRVPGGHGAEPRPQRTDPVAVLIGCLPRRDPQRLLEHRIHERRAVQLDPVLGVTGHGDVVVATRGHGHGVVLTCPVRAHPARPQTTAGPPRLCTRDQHHLGTSGLQIQARVIDQGLRHVATDTRVPRPRPGGADATCEQQARVPVPPRQQVDHAHRVHGLQHTWIRGVPGGLGHQVHRFGGRVLVVLTDLAVPDQHGRSIHGHRTYSTTRRAGEVSRPLIQATSFSTQPSTASTSVSTYIRSTNASG